MTAMRCRAALSCRLPDLVIRTRPAVLPDHTGIGATPAWRANSPRLVNRLTAGGLADQLRRGQRPAPGHCHQRRRGLAASTPIRLCSVVDPPVRRHDVVEFVPRQFGDHRRRRRRASPERCAGAWPNPATRFAAHARGPARGPATSSRLIVAVRCATRTSRRSTSNFNSRDTSSWEATGRSGSPQERPRHRQRIDRIGLAPGAGATPASSPSSSAAPAPPSARR